jgi:hypothetical protein
MMPLDAETNVVMAESTLHVHARDVPWMFGAMRVLLGAKTNVVMAGTTYCGVFCMRLARLRCLLLGCETKR